MSQVHESAIIGDEVELGEGVKIGPLCVLTGKVKLGDGVRLLSGVSIQGPVEIGSNTVVYPGAMIGFEPQDFKFKPGAASAGVVIGSDSILREFVTIHGASNDHTPTRVGNRTMMMVSSHAGHDACVGDDVVMVNGSMLGGHSVVEDRVLISGTAAVHQFSRVGYQSMCSAGTILTGDLPPYCLAVGRNDLVGLNLVGMRRSGMSANEIDAVRYAFTHVFRKDLQLPVMKEALAELGERSPAVKRISEFVNESKRPVLAFSGRKGPR